MQEEFLFFGKGFQNEESNYVHLPTSSLRDGFTFGQLITSACMQTTEEEESVRKLAVKVQTNKCKFIL